MKFKLDRIDGTLAGYIEKTAPLRAEWSGWVEFQRKHASRLAYMQASPRLEPVREGEDEFAINPPLLVRKQEFRETVNCTLTQNKEGISFADQYAAAIREYNKTALAKPITPEQLVNIHRLLYMEIQYLGGCETEWKDSGDGANSGDGGSNNGKPSLSILPGKSAPALFDRTANNNAALLRFGLAVSASATPRAAAASVAPASDPAPADLAAAASAAPDASPAPAVFPAPAANASAAPAAAASTAASTAASAAAAHTDASAAPAAAASVAAAASAAAAAAAGGATAEQDEDLEDISKWDHRSGNFPLTDSALARMEFSIPARPRYYFAAALILFMRTSRTDKEEEVFQKLLALWPDWFGGTELDYEYLKKGPPRKGCHEYNEAERNWCEVRLQVLDSNIKVASDRDRLGLPAKGRRSAAPATGNDQRTTNVRREQDALLDRPTTTDSPRVMSTASKRNTGDESDVSDLGVQAKKRGRADSDQRDRSAASAAAASSAGAHDRRVSPHAGPRVKRTASKPRNEDAESDVSETDVRAKKSRREGGKRRREPEHRNDDCSEVTDEIPKRGIISKEGRIVSKKDSRPLVADNGLRDKYKSSYRCPSNTRRWQGIELDLGQAFKLAVWTHHGPHMPIERSGHIETRTALFRTAAYYSLSMDGSEEEEIMQDPKFHDFLYILVLVAKQLRYQTLAESRVYFADNVFTHFRASKAVQREFMRKGICKASD